MKRTKNPRAPMSNSLLDRSNARPSFLHLLHSQQYGSLSTHAFENRIHHLITKNLEDEGEQDKMEHGTLLNDDSQNYDKIIVNLRYLHVENKWPFFDQISRLYRSDERDLLSEAMPIVTKIVRKVNEKEKFEAVDYSSFNDLIAIGRNYNINFFFFFPAELIQEIFDITSIHYLIDKDDNDFSDKIVRQYDSDCTKKVTAGMAILYSYYWFCASYIIPLESKTKILRSLEQSHNLSSDHIVGRLVGRFLSCLSSIGQADQNDFQADQNDLQYLIQLEGIHDDYSDHQMQIFVDLAYLFKIAILYGQSVEEIVTQIFQDYNNRDLRICLLSIMIFFGHCPSVCCLMEKIANDPIMMKDIYMGVGGQSQGITPIQALVASNDDALYYLGTESESISCSHPLKENSSGFVVSLKAMESNFLLRLCLSKVDAKNRGFFNLNERIDCSAYRQPCIVRLFNSNPKTLVWFYLNNVYIINQFDIKAWFLFGLLDENLHRSFSHPVLLGISCMNYSNQDTDEKYPADVIITDGDIRKFMTPEEDHNETPEEDHNETPEEGHNEYEFDKYQTIRWFLHFLPIPPQFNRLTEENNNSHMTLT